MIYRCIIYTEREKTMGNKLTELTFEGTFDLGRPLNVAEIKGIIGDVTQEDIDRLILCDKRDNKRTEYVKVVYCEDCKWWEHYEDKKHNCGYSLCGNPKMMNDIHMLTMYATDYCSKGEPKHD